MEVKYPMNSNIVNSYMDYFNKSYRIYGPYDSTKEYSENVESTNQILNTAMASYSQEVRSFILEMTDILKDTFNMLVALEPSSNDDYASEEATLIGNIAKFYIMQSAAHHSRIFAQVPSTITSNPDYPNLRLHLIAGAGGPYGLYLQATIRCDETGTQYQATYPTLDSNTVKPDNGGQSSSDSSDKISVMITCMECTVRESTEVETVANTSYAYTFDKNGRSATFHFTPSTGCVLSAITYDGNRAANTEEITDLPGVTVGRASNGSYELVVTDMSKDHNIEFICAYNANAPVYNVDADFVNCQTTNTFPANYIENSAVNVSFRRYPFTLLDKLIIDDCDIIENFVSKGIRKFDYSDGNIFPEGPVSVNVTQSDETVNILWNGIRANHFIDIAYKKQKFNVRCVGTHCTISTPTEKIVEAHDNVSFDVVLDAGYTRAKATIYPAANAVLPDASQVNTAVHFSGSSVVVTDVVCDVIVSVEAVEGDEDYTITGNFINCYYPIENPDIPGKIIHQHQITIKDLRVGETYGIMFVAEDGYTIDVNKSKLTIDGQQVPMSGRVSFTETNADGTVNTQRGILSFPLINESHSFIIELVKDNNGGGENPDDPDNPGGGDDPDNPGGGDNPGGDDPNNPGGGDDPNDPNNPGDNPGGGDDPDNPGGGDDPDPNAPVFDPEVDNPRVTFHLTNLSPTNIRVNNEESELIVPETGDPYIVLNKGDEVSIQLISVLNSYITTLAVKNRDGSKEYQKVIVPNELSGGTAVVELNYVNANIYANVISHLYNYDITLTNVTHDFLVDPGTFTIVSGA